MPEQQTHREDTMQRIAFDAVLGVMLVGGSAALAQTPTWTPPPESARCPSKWGAGDERGSANHMKPQTVLNAVKLIKTGEIIEIGHVLSDKMPFFGTRRFRSEEHTSELQSLRHLVC